MFSALDKDKNGYIDRDELKTSFAGLGIPLSDDDVAEMMAEADVYADRIYFEGSTRLFCCVDCSVCEVDVGPPFRRAAIPRGRHSEGPPFRRVRHFQPFPAVTTYG